MSSAWLTGDCGQWDCLSAAARCRAGGAGNYLRQGSQPAALGDRRRRVAFDRDRDPMAGDLRSIASAISIVTDLERVTDHAAGIAKIAILTSNEPPLEAAGRPATNGRD